MATSREALHVAAEVRVPVEPLGSAAVELFLERARAARPGFEPDDDTATLAAEIARRLDGLPLAIELAAARVNVLGLGEIVSILERRAALLHDGSASDPSRTALRALVEWSYDLLHGDEKTLLQQLAVHRGGASLGSLVAVGETHGLNEATVAYLLGALVDKSIVSASFPDGAARYDMLDTVREYALHGLAESGALAAVRAAHAAYFAELAEEASVGLRGPDWLAWRRRLEVENDNLWAALAFAGEAPDPDSAARLGTLGWYFGLAERVSEGRRFLELALDAARRRRSRRSADRAAREPLLPGHRGARARGRPPGGRERAFARRRRRTAPAARAGAVDPRACRRAFRRAGTGRCAGAGRVRRVRGDGRRLGPRSHQRHPRDRGGGGRRRPGGRRHGGDRPPPRRRDRVRRIPRSGAAARGVGGRATGGRGGSGGGIPRRARARAARRLRRPRGVRPDRARLDRARERRPPARPRSSSGRRLPRPRPPTRRGWRRTPASSSPARPRRPETRTPPIACTARFSSGRRRNGRTGRARPSSSRLPAARRPRRSLDSRRSPPRAELAEGPARLAERWHRRPRAFALSKTDEQEARYEHNHD